MIRRLAPVALLALALGGAHPAASSAPLTVKVAANRLVDGSGQTLRLRGVNRSGLEYMCVSGAASGDFADGPTDAAAIAAMRSWHINVVRLPLNASCWVGRASYRSVVTGFVGRLHDAGLYVILDLHLNTKAQTPMADKAHALAFWSSVAKTFRSDRAALFDLYNEPFNISWRCWRDGCGAYAGMQALVNRVRATGAKQPIMLGACSGRTISRSGGAGCRRTRRISWWRRSTSTTSTRASRSSAGTPGLRRWRRSFRSSPASSAKTTVHTRSSTRT